MSARTSLDHAIRSQSVDLIRMLAIEVGTIDLYTAAQICGVYAARAPEKFDRACVRWVGRLCTEAPGIDVLEVKRAVDALAGLTGTDDAQRLLVIRDVLRGGSYH